MASQVDADICIVGSGPAGALVASELAGRGKRIAIIEAGGWHDQDARGRRLEDGDAAQLAIDEPHLHVPMRVYSSTQWVYWQARKVGGNTRLWGSWCPRALESQFQPHAHYGVGVDWPIDYAELEPFYCQAEEELGVSGEAAPDGRPWRSRPYPLPASHRDHVGQLLARACTELGYSWEQAPVARAMQPYREREACRICNASGCTMCPTTARYTSELHVRRALADPDVSLHTDTTAARFVVGEDGRVRELECFRPDRSRCSVRAGTFVLAANAIGSARLLLLSAQAGHPRGLANSSDTVGRYFMTHPVYDFHARLPQRVLAARSPSTVVCRHFEEGPHLREGAGFRIFFNGADRSPTMHGLRLLAQGLYGSRFKRELKRAAGCSVKASVVTDVQPRADNRVELDPEHLDHFGQPGLQVRYEYAPYDENGRKLGAATVARVLEVLDAKQIFDDVHDMAHQLGTTRMGDAPATSVVDRDLRAHDVANLYVVGGSVFPNALGPTNPTLTIAALALRLAHHLRQQGA